MTETAVPGFYADHVFISLSGGLDSTCLMMAMLASGKTVHAISFKYGQKHSIELKKVTKNIRFLQSLGMKVDHHVVDLTSAFALSASTLKADGGAIPEGHYADENMKSTVVENRNVIFSSIIYGMALGFANHNNCNVIITQGIHAGDHTIYPDCRPESHQAAQHLYKISNWGSERVEFEAPFVNLSKTEVLQAGIAAMESMGLKKSAIKKILSNTHTCYNPDSEGRSCGKCGSCTERLEAFATVGMQDLITYQPNAFDTVGVGNPMPEEA